jgi:serine/threonine-protein phosphatase 2B regulatory subunit
MRLDRGKTGTIAADDLLMVPEVSMNPLAARLTALFERDADDRINFRSFVAGLSVFSERARPDVRKRGAWHHRARLPACRMPPHPPTSSLHRLLPRPPCCRCSAPLNPSDSAAVFRLYDVDGDGAISEADLRVVLEMIVGASMPPPTVAQVISMTIASADKDGDGRISFEDFEQVRGAARSAAVRQLPLRPCTFATPNPLIAGPRSRLQSLEHFSWDAMSVPVKSSSRWERRLGEDGNGGGGGGGGGSSGGSAFPHSASGVRLNDALAALQLSAAQEELARITQSATSLRQPAGAAAADSTAPVGGGTM